MEHPRLARKLCRLIMAIIDRCGYFRTAEGTRIYRLLDATTYLRMDADLSLYLATGESTRLPSEWRRVDDCLPHRDLSWLRVQILKRLPYLRPTNEQTDYQWALDLLQGHKPPASPTESAQ